MIGGVPVSEFMKQVAAYYGYENDAALQSNYTSYCRQKEMLWLAGCLYNDSITLTLSDGTTSVHKFVSSLGSSRAGYVARYNMAGDVFVLDLKRFSDDKSVDDAVKAIEQAVINGTKKFIVDLRGNGGGSTNVGEKILRAMGIPPPKKNRYLPTVQRFVEESVWHYRGYNPIAIIFQRQKLEQRFCFSSHRFRLIQCCYGIRMLDSRRKIRKYHRTTQH